MRNLDDFRQSSNHLENGQKSERIRINPQVASANSYRLSLRRSGSIQHFFEPVECQDHDLTILNIDQLFLTEVR